MTLEEQNKLVLDNLGLVSDVIRTKVKLGEDEWEDLFQEGCVGLIVASRNFDKDKGYKFSTYAFPCILGYIIRYKRQRSNRNHGVYTTSTAQDKLTEARKIADENNLDISKATDLDKLLELCDCPKDIFVNVTSLNKLANDETGESSEIIDLIPDTNNSLEEVEFRMFVDQLLDLLKRNLTNRQYIIMSYIILTYVDTGVKLTYREVAESLGVSKQSVNKTVHQVISLVKKKGVLDMLK